METWGSGRLEGKRGCEEKRKVESRREKPEARKGRAEG